MGVDVSLYAVGKVTNEELEAAETFMAERVEKDGYYDTILRRTPTYLPEGVEVQTLDRYYGPRYERGHWPTIYNAIRCLKVALPNCTVHYGGDTDDESPEATDEYLAEIWDHYLSSHGFDYHKHIDWVMKR